MSCFRGGQFYVIPSFDDMPVGTAQWVLEHCKIRVHGTTGFHFSPSFLIVCCFLLGSEVQSLCEIVALPFVTPMYTPLHNHSINNCGFKASDPFCSPWRNKHELLFSPLSTFFLNVGISLEFQQCFPAALEAWFEAWTTQESCWERKSHSGLEIMDSSPKSFSIGCQKERLGLPLFETCPWWWCVPAKLADTTGVFALLQSCYMSHQLVSAVCGTLQHIKDHACSVGSDTFPLCWPCPMCEYKWCQGRRRDTSPNFFTVSQIVTDKS